MSTVVVPVYIYPLPGAWDPLMEAARANPDVQFIAIVNPGNGPGPNPLPDASYEAALTELCALPNVQPIGYVHCTYCKRDMAPIKADIDTYAAWEANSGGRYRVDGIFIDEAPWEPAQRENMALLAQHIRTAWKLAAAKRAEASGASPQSPLSPAAHNPTTIATTGVVIYNPGVVVAKGFIEDADWTVVFEQSHQHWYDYFLQHGINQIPSHLRHKAVAMVHSFGHLDKRTNAAILAGNAGAVPPPANRNGHSNGNRAGSPPKTPSRKSTDPPMSPTSEAGERLASSALTDQIVQLGFGGIYVTDQLGGGYNHWPAVWHTVADQLGAKLRAK